MDESLGVEHVAADETSVAFLNRWHVLVSTTNWEKGRIIFEWREALRVAGAASPQFSDEAWSRRVGSVSGQHVGRLRRVHERFGSERETFPKLSWSHFCAALEWHDAELWLEGAEQSDWSVSDMRRQRWEAFGAVEADRPREEDVVTADVDEDFSSAETSEVRDVSANRNERSSESSGGSDFVESTFSDSGESTTVESSDDSAFDSFSATEGEPVRPFAHLGDLPADMQQALEAFKLSIIQHKLAGWSDVAQRDVLAALDALKQLAMASGE